MVGLCMCYLLLTCAVVIPHAAALTNQELYEILKENSEDVVENYDDVTMESDDDILDIPGNPEDPVDIEYFLNKVFNGMLQTDVTQKGDTNLVGIARCGCRRRSCQCCLGKTWKVRFLFHTFRAGLHACLKLEYLGRHNFGFRLTFTVNGRTLYRKEVSLRRPPALCFPIPKLGMFAKVCFGLYDIDLRRKRACARITGKLSLIFKTFKIHIRLGCFRLPFLDDELLRKVEYDAMSSFQNTHDEDLDLDELDVKESFQNMHDADLDLDEQDVKESFQNVHEADLDLNLDQQDAITIFEDDDPLTSDDIFEMMK